MDPVFSGRQCTVCANGRLAYIYDANSGRLFLKCEECLTEYWDLAEPADLFRTEDRTAPTRYARIDEIAHPPAP
jgi:hypothetical protein